MFHCSFKDGSSYAENSEDKSIKDDTKSCFYDIDVEEVSRFNLSGEGHTYTIDLNDGHFEIDGLRFQMHEEIDLKDFRLIFFRRHTHSFSTDYEELAHDIVFRFGWQANTPEGENVQRIMEIK